MAARPPALQLFLGVLALLPVFASAASFDAAAKSTNESGLDLYRQIVSGDDNICISPFSVSCALAMTVEGADGQTRMEMCRVLHLDSNTEPGPSFRLLQQSIAEISAQTAKIAEASKNGGGPSEPITIAIANRLFPQSGYEFRKDFFARVKENYGAPPEPLDFKRNGAAATNRINDWVAKETRDRIRDLIPQPLDSTTRLVLANAIYLKAPWWHEFPVSETKPEPFHIKGNDPVDVPTMLGRKSYGYAKNEGFTAVSIPYSGGDLQFVIFLPDESPSRTGMTGLKSLEQKLTGSVLASCAKLKPTELILHLPRFKFEPPTMRLSEQLKALGMKTAFDIPSGSANFDRMARRKPDDYLAISDVFHKTFIAVDEKGTEAAAATAVAMRTMSALVKPAVLPIEVKVDRPFLYAIQHVPSGACLFIGRVTDPR
ncbi:MAG TPA: serpin family protein [Chthoniobacterales bacterium]|jgi:serpin B